MSNVNNGSQNTGKGVAWQSGAYTLVTSALTMLRQEEHKVKASLGLTEGNEGTLDIAQG